MRLIIAGFVIAILLGSCTKDDGIKRVRHQLSIETGKLLEFDLGGFPTEGMISISKQAEHFQVSEIEFNLYRYQSSQVFIGRDLVVIERRDGTGVGSFEFISHIELEIVVNE